MDILGTFELFWRLPAKIFWNKNIFVSHVETNNDTDYLTQAQISDSEVFLTVYNNRKVYNLLSAVLYKKKLLNENKNSKIFNKRSVN